MAGVFPPDALNQVAIGRNRNQSVSGFAGVCMAVPGLGRQDGVCRRLDRANIGSLGADRLEWLAADGGDGLQQLWSNFGPADQQQRADGVERGLPKSPTAIGAAR